MAAAILDHAIDRKALAGLDQHQVAQAQLGDRHIFFPVANHAHCALRAQCLERANGAGGLAFGTAFQVLAQQHQGDYHRRGLEVQVRGHAGGGLGPFVEAQAVTGAGPQGNQQVHVAGAGTHGFPGGDIKAGAENELHRGGQQELRPGGQHPVQAEWLYQHGQHQWQRQQQCCCHCQAFVTQAALGGGLLVFGGLRHTGAVAGLVYRFDQQVVIEGGQRFKVGTFIGQVDTHPLHPGHFAKGPLHAAHATGAGHAADLQFQRARGHAVAGFAYRIDQGWQAVGRGLDTGFFSGEVDADVFSAADLAQCALDPASTAGTGHAGDRQVIGGGCGHGSPPWTGLQHQPCHAGKVNSLDRRASIPAHIDPW